VILLLTIISQGHYKRIYVENVMGGIFCIPAEITLTLAAETFFKLGGYQSYQK
jgi:hypothetical protein